MCDYTKYRAEAAVNATLQLILDANLDIEEVKEFMRQLNERVNESIEYTEGFTKFSVAGKIVIDKAMLHSGG